MKGCSFGWKITTSLEKHILLQWKTYVFHLWSTELETQYVYIHIYIYIYIYSPIFQRNSIYTRQTPITDDKPLLHMTFQENEAALDPEVEGLGYGARDGFIRVYASRAQGKP